MRAAIVHQPACRWKLKYHRHEVDGLPENLRASSSRWKLKYHRHEVGGLPESLRASSSRWKLKYHRHEVGGLPENLRASSCRWKLKYHRHEVGGVFKRDLLLSLHLPGGRSWHNSRTVGLLQCRGL